MRNSSLLKESKIFDPRDSLTAAYGSDLVDASVTKRGEHWWMALAGQPGGYGATDLYSAYLPKGAALSASGWTPLLDGAGRLAPLSARNKSARWDGNGGRHCPSYVQGWDPHKKLGWSAFTTQVPPRTFGDPTRSASLNGTESNGRISRNPRSGPARTGSTAASTSPISCITTANGRCGMSRVLTTKTIWSTATRKAQMDAQAGANTLYLPRRRRRCSISAFGSETADSRLSLLVSGWEGVKCRRRLGCGGAAQNIHPVPCPTGASRSRSWRVKIAAGMRGRGSHRFNSRMIRVGAGSFSLTGCIGRPIRVRSRLSSPWGVRRLNCQLRHSVATTLESGIN